MTRRSYRLAVALYAGGAAATLFANVIEPWPIRRVFLLVACVAQLGGGIYLGLRTKSAVWVFWSLYVAALVAGWIVRVEVDPSEIVLWTIGGVGVLFALLAMGLTALQSQRAKELERVLSSESTSLAFFATMLFVLTFGLFEVWFELPQVSMWAVWMFGMVAWAFFWFVVRRRFF